MRFWNGPRAGGPPESGFAGETRRNHHQGAGERPQSALPARIGMRADLQRLKRDTDTGRSGVGSADSSAAAQAVCPRPCHPHPARKRRARLPAPIRGSPSDCWRGTRRHFLSFVAAMVLILAGLGYAAYRWLSPGSGARIDTLAVLPFTNVTADPNTDYLSDGLTESLIGSLSRLPNLTVRPRSSVMRYHRRISICRRPPPSCK